jgi:hypothetical protein
MIVVVVEVVKLQVVASGGSPVFLWLQLWCWWLHVMVSWSSLSSRGWSYCYVDPGCQCTGVAMGGTNLVPHSHSHSHSLPCGWLARHHFCGCQTIHDVCRLGQSMMVGGSLQQHGGEVRTRFLHSLGICCR